MADRSETGAYVGVDKNGIVQSMLVDRRDELTARTVADFIRDGLTIHRTDCTTAADAMGERWEDRK